VRTVQTAGVVDVTIACIGKPPDAVLKSPSFPAADAIISPMAS
jgi:hypothetical protein